MKKKDSVKTLDEIQEKYSGFSLENRTLGTQCLVVGEATLNFINQHKFIICLATSYLFYPALTSLVGSTTENNTRFADGTVSSENRYTKINDSSENILKTERNGTGLCEIKTDNGSSGIALEISGVPPTSTEQH
jgi:hypothetical protein